MGKPLVLLLGWRVRGQKHVFIEFGNICNADICGISIVMEIFLLISWKMLAIDCVCVFVLCFSHNNHFFYWSRVFHRSWLWSSSGEIVDLRCGTIILFPFSRDWLISFILEREFEIAPKLQPANKRLCDQTWKSRETGRFLHPSLSSLSVRGEFYSFLCYQETWVQVIPCIWGILLIWVCLPSRVTFDVFESNRQPELLFSIIQ